MNRTSVKSTDGEQQHFRQSRQSQGESGLGEMERTGSDHRTDRSGETDRTTGDALRKSYYDEDRPPTPLWKRFRWKAWAMKKGIIRRDEQTARFKNVCARKPKTPVVNDWEIVETPVEDMSKTYVEFDGEGLDEFEDIGLLDGPRLTVEFEEGQRFLLDGARKSKADSFFRTGSVTELKSNRKTVEKHNEQLQVPSTSASQGNINDESDEETEGNNLEETGLIPGGGKMWYHCASMNSDDLRKFCNLDSSQTTVGSCYVLRREPTLFTPVLDPVFQDIHSELPKYPEIIENYRQIKETTSYSIDFERFKSYSVTDYHLNEKEGLDSGFYLFSDSWTDQEISITVDILKDEIVKACQEEAKGVIHSAEVLPVPPPTPAPETLAAASSAETGSPEVPLTAPINSLQLIVEHWNWRKDNCRGKTLISTTIDDYWITHVRLPAGRNTFRIWLLIDSESDMFEGAEEPGEDEPGQYTILKRRSPTFSFIIKIIAQSPIYLGSRIEVQNYMTNEPVVLLRQAEILADTIWELFPCFTRKCVAYKQIIEQIRRSYCPACPEPKIVNKFAKGVHDTFESLFIALITKLNYGSLDKMLIQTLRVLFVNPMIGRDLAPPLYASPRKSIDTDTAEVKRSSWRRSKEFDSNHTKATIIIQKFYRGWRVRRLFHMRRKSHKHFKMMQYNVWRIAFLLANETDCVFAQKDNKSIDLGNEEEETAECADKASGFTVSLPNPPRWSYRLLKKLLELHPGLANVHPYANSTLQHIKIQEIEGELPAVKKPFLKCPFFTNILMTSPGTQTSFCEIDLQVYPPLGIYLKVKNNDTKKSLPLVNNRLFIGDLEENENGYTVQCYRWVLPDTSYGITDRNPSNNWKIRLITPHAQNGPYFQEEQDLESSKSSSGLDEGVPVTPSLLRCNFDDHFDDAVDDMNQDIMSMGINE